MKFYKVNIKLGYSIVIKDKLDNYKFDIYQSRRVKAISENGAIRKVMSDVQREFNERVEKYDAESIVKAESYYDSGLYRILNKYKKRIVHIKLDGVNITSAYEMTAKEAIEYFTLTDIMEAWR